MIEIVVAITILAVIAAVAVPTLRGLREEEQAREPVREIAELVQEVRQRAIQEKRAYQIVIERDGLHAVPGADTFLKRDEFLKFLEDLRTPPPATGMNRTEPERAGVARQEVQGRPEASSSAADRFSGQAAADARPGEEAEPVMPWTKSVELEGVAECRALLWGDGEWDAIEGNELRCWVFQPTGMASPMRLKLVLGGVECEAGFDALTGEIVSERSRPAGLLTSAP